MNECLERHSLRYWISSIEYQPFVSPSSCLTWELLGPDSVAAVYLAEAVAVCMEVPS